MPWVWIEICTTGTLPSGASYLSCSSEYVYVPEGDYGGGGGGGTSVPPTYTVYPVVSVEDQDVTVTWTTRDSNGVLLNPQGQLNASVIIRNAQNQTVASTTIPGTYGGANPQTATLVVPEGQGYTALVAVEYIGYPSTIEGQGVSAAFDVGPPPPPPPPPVPPFDASMGMMAA